MSLILSDLLAMVQLGGDSTPVIPVRFSPISSAWHRTPESFSAGLAIGSRSESVCNKPHAAVTCAAR